MSSRLGSRILVFGTLLAGVVIAVLFFTKPDTQAPPFFEREAGETEEDFASKWNQEYLMLRDPVTRRVPENVFQKEQSLARERLATQVRSLGKYSALTWIERGPNNASGRVRGFGIDVRAQTAPAITIIAGGVSGGIWKSTNDGATWAQKTTSTQVHGITAVKQDPRPGRENTWYAGTGERIGGSASAAGASYAGDGVYKSTDNGETWRLLASTVTNAPASFKSNWQYVYRIDVDRSNTTNDEVYAATYGGVYRSTDGGGTWSQTLVLGDDQANSSDVIVTSNGVVYACGSKAQSGTSGIFRSTDGETWVNITPSNFPNAFGRMVLGVAPSNENTVYVLVQGVDVQGSDQVNGHQLWKYVYGSGDGTGANGTWDNRGANLPTEQRVGPTNFDTQGGYDMLIAVKPDNENFLIFGGVNLYRTTDGLQTASNVAHIGGYGQEGLGTANLLGDYINNHPDQHYGAFLPGSTMVFYNANDGGMHKTLDITGTPNAGFWQTPRRTGFNITQPYALSIDPQVGLPIIAAGLQDRGNWVARTPNSGSTPASWQEATGGDGAVCVIASDGWLYGSTSKGAIFRVMKTEIAEPIYTTANTTFAQFKPADAVEQLFITPFALDPNNPGVLYYSAGKGAFKGGLWRNSDARTATEKAGWTFLTTTQMAADEFVTAIGVSKEQKANVVYYGTSEGKVYRIDDAQSGSEPQTVDVWTNKGLPSAYVIRLAVDPKNSARVVLVFSNYNVRSVWYTTDAGGTWTDISGNLEQNPDGSGNGPSVRWANVIHTGQTPSIFVSTSTGLYSTASINGSATQWTQEAIDAIGTMVFVMSDYRARDGTFVVATHGRGIFQTTVGTPPPANRAPAVQLLSVSQNPATVGSEVTLSLRPSDPDSETVKVTVDWGDGSTTAYGADAPSGSTLQFKHTYSTAGNFSIKAKAKDARSLEGNWSAELSIEVRVASALENVASVPTRYELLSNYPNPFNPSTIIRFGLPVSSQVTLKVYDVSGREVRTLINNQLSAGFHSVTFNAAGLSNGTYIYRLRANGFEASRKMILVK